MVTPHATAAPTAAAVVPGLNISSAAVLSRLTAQPKFSQQLKQLPKYNEAVGLHLMLHDLVEQQVPLRAARTKVSDGQGVLLKQAVAGELKGWPLMVQVGCRASKRCSTPQARTAIRSQPYVLFVQAAVASSAEFLQVMYTAAVPGGIQQHMPHNRMRWVLFSCFALPADLQGCCSY
jgi:hypothetical protein